MIKCATIWQNDKNLHNLKSFTYEYGGNLLLVNNGYVKNVGKGLALSERCGKI